MGRNFPDCSGGSRRWSIHAALSRALRRITFIPRFSLPGVSPRALLESATIFRPNVASATHVLSVSSWYPSSLRQSRPSCRMSTTIRTDANPLDVHTSLSIKPSASSQPADSLPPPPFHYHGPVTLAKDYRYRQPLPAPPSDRVAQTRPRGAAYSSTEPCNPRSPQLA